MPVPKQRVGHSDQGHRRSCWKASTPTLTRCTTCGDAKLMHKVCLSCGSYDGKMVSERLVKTKGRFAN